MSVFAVNGKRCEGYRSCSLLFNRRRLRRLTALFGGGGGGDEANTAAADAAVAVTVRSRQTQFQFHFEMITQIKTEAADDQL